MSLLIKQVMDKKFSVMINDDEEIKAANIRSKNYIKIEKHTNYSTDKCKSSGKF